MDSESTINLQDLDNRITEALKALSRKQRKFVEVYAAGDNAGTAAIKAGYSPGGSHVHASRMLNQVNYAHVQHALELLRTRHALDHGMPLAWKRKVLANVAETASDVDGRGYVPSAAVRAVNEMNLMDGTHAPKQHHVTSMSVNVDLNYQIDVPREEPVVIEHDDVSEKKEGVSAYIGQGKENK